MELRALRYFATAVGAGSLSAAAEQLHLTQPSLSVAISRLETELGVELLVRTSRGVTPTSAGRFLLERAARLLGDADDIAQELTSFGEGVSGTVNIAAVPVLMWQKIPALLRAHSLAAPGIEYRLFDPPPWTAIDLLAARQVDLAAIVVADPVSFARRHRGVFEVIDWGEVPLVAVFPPERSDVPDPLPFADLADEHLFLPRRTAAVPSLPEAVEAAFESQGMQPASWRNAETIQAILPLIEGGLGSAVLPDPDRASLARFQVSVRQLDPEPRPLRALVLARAGTGSGPAVRRVLERIRSTQANDNSEPLSDHV